MVYKRKPEVVERERRMQDALAAMRRNPNLSIRRVAGRFDVPRATLAKRAKGRQSRCESREEIHTLSSIEEKELVRWISMLSCTGFAPKHDLIREMAEKVRLRRLRGVNDDSIERVTYPPLGKEWVANFIERHSEIQTVVGHAIEKSRIEGTMAPVLRKWFDAYKSAVVDDPNVLDENVYNFDETGFSIGTIKAGKVVINRVVKNSYRAQPGRQEWVSVIECVSATGIALSPYIIFKGKNVNARWIPESVPHGWRIAASENGWTSNRDACIYVRTVFERETREKAHGRPRVLICDGHGSHITGDFLEHCVQNNIKLLILPAHSSHYTQPLDIGIFSPIKEYLSQALTRIVNAQVAMLQKVEWFEGFIIARQKGLSLSNILGSWLGAGLVPFNPHKVLRRIGAELTPTPPSSPGSTTPPPNFSNDILQSPVDSARVRTASNMLIEELERYVNTPKRNFIRCLTDRIEALECRLSITSAAKANAEEVLAARKRRESGTRGIFKGQHSIASEDFLAKVRKEEQRIAEQKKRRGKKALNEAAMVESQAAIGNVDERDYDESIPIVDAAMN